MSDTPTVPETLGGALIRLREALAEAGLDEPAREARLVLAVATGFSGADLITGEHQTLDPEQTLRLRDVLRRRCMREPLSRIEGRRGFFGLEFEINRDVLDPRPETEHLVEAALAQIGHDQPAHILDIGTGSGAIVLAVLHACPLATGLGVDISEDALAVARRNAVALKLAERANFISSDLFSGVSGRFDVILSNPPYIPAALAATLAPEVRLHDPALALFAAGDGLGYYRAILADAHRFLVPHGFLGFETGHDQAPRVAGLMCEAGYERIAILDDYAGHGRCVTGIGA